MSVIKFSSLQGIELAKPGVPNKAWRQRQRSTGPWLKSAPVA